MCVVAFECVWATGSGYSWGWGNSPPHGISLKLKEKVDDPASVGEDSRGDDAL